MGAYIIQDAEKEATLNLNIATDIPLVINDRLVDTSGSLLYSDDNCNAGATVWVPESFGNVNLVNGRVMPYVEIPPTQVRFRVVNAANSRRYEFPVPFPNLCKVVATDSGFVETPQLLGDTLAIFPLERVELVCDFSGVADGTAYDLIDAQSSSQSTPYDPRVLQIRIAERLLTDAMTVREIPTTLNKFKSLKALYEAGGQERNVTLGEMTDAMSCPTMTTIHYKEKQSSLSNIANALQCVKGTVEKWNFINPTADPHPFHWHLVHVQCGDTEATIKTNELKDVAVIPSAGDRAADTITQVCYVACTPGDYLIENTTRDAEDFGFDTTEPYVAHCHVLEHEENMMMSWFRIIEEYRSGGSGHNSTSSSVGSGSHSSIDDGSSSPTVGSASWSEIDSGSDSQGGQHSYPATNVTYAQYHRFGTEEYAKYHRCDGHLNGQGMYTTTNGGSDDNNSYDSSPSERSGKGHVMTAISSTVVAKGEQTQYGGGDANTGDGSVTQGYMRADSRNEMRTSDNDASDSGQGDGADSKIENTTTTDVTGNEGITTTSKHADITSTSGKTGQGYSTTSSGVDTAVDFAAVAGSNRTAVAEEGNTGNAKTGSSSATENGQNSPTRGRYTGEDNAAVRAESDEDVMAGFTANAKNTNKFAASRAFGSSGTSNPTTSTADTAGSHVIATTDISHGADTDNTAREGDAGQDYSETADGITTGDNFDEMYREVDAGEGYAKTHPGIATATSDSTGSSKTGNLGVSIDNTSGQIRKCAGD